MRPMKIQISLHVCLHWALIPEDTFSHVKAHFYYVIICIVVKDIDQRMFSFGCLFSAYHIHRLWRICCSNQAIVVYRSLNNSAIKADFIVRKKNKKKKTTKLINEYQFD